MAAHTVIYEILLAAFYSRENLELVSCHCLNVSADKIIQIKIQEGYTPGTGFDQFPFPKGLSALYSLDSQTIKKCT